MREGLSRSRRQRKAKIACVQKMTELLKVCRIKTSSKVPNSTKTLKEKKSCAKPKQRRHSPEKLPDPEDVDFTPPCSGADYEDSDEEFLIPLSVKRKPTKKKFPSLEKSQERIRSIIDSKISDDESGGGSDEECSMRSDINTSMGTIQSQDRMDGSRDSGAYPRRKISCRNSSNSEVSQSSSQSQGSLRPTYLMGYLQRVKTWKRPSDKSDSQTQNQDQTQNDKNKDKAVDGGDDDSDEVIILSD